MAFSNTKQITALSAVLAMTLAACGGGGEGSSGSSGATAAELAGSTITISGIVAKQVAFAGASVNATNSTGAVGSAVAVATDGGYTLIIPASTAMPLVLTASKLSPTGELETYSSVVADRANTTANITPITNLIASLLSSNGNPEQLAKQVAGGASISQATLSAKTLAVQSTLKPALNALNVGTIDPIRGAFSANNAGHHKLIQSLSISISPTTAGANIEVALRSKASSASAQPVFVQFANNQADLPVLGAVASSDFIADGMVEKLGQLLADVQGCYALPLATRVSTALPGDALALGSAKDVVAPLCRGIFMGNNPGTYRNSGAVVGRNNAETVAFSNLFEANSTGLIFSNPEYQYTLANGDIGFSFTTTLPGIFSQPSVNILRLDPADQKLKFIGDQYFYSGKVTPFVQNREFPLLNQSQWNYISTGYLLSVENTPQVIATNQLKKIEVVAPNGATYNLVLEPGGTQFLSSSGQAFTGYLRLRSEFKEVTKTVAPSNKLISEQSVSASVVPALTDASIAAIPRQAAWVFRYFRTGNLGSDPDVVQIYRTRSRAPTIAELRAKAFVGVTSTTLSNWANAVSATTGRIGLSSNSPFNVSWTVPTGALPPVSSTLGLTYFVTGSEPRPSATALDMVDFLAGSVTNSAIVCQARNVADVHCSGASNGGFKVGSEAILVNLNGVDSAGINVETSYSFGVLSIAP